MTFLWNHIELMKQFTSVMLVFILLSSLVFALYHSQKKNKETHLSLYDLIGFFVNEAVFNFFGLLIVFLPIFTLGIIAYSGLTSIRPAIAYIIILLMVIVIAGFAYHLICRKHQVALEQPATVVVTALFILFTIDIFQTLLSLFTQAASITQLDGALQQMSEVIPALLGIIIILSLLRCLYLLFQPVIFKHQEHQA